MTTVRGRVKDRCVICRTTDKTLSVKFPPSSPYGRFDGVVCLEHLYERLDDYAESLASANKPVQKSPEKNVPK